jgi:cation diffusion facilitator family transporter
MLVSLAVAGALLLVKLGVGFATGSLGLISSGIESSGDLIAAALTFFAVRLGARPADASHPYGHRRAENLGALGEAAILFAGGIVVSVAAVMRLSRGGEGHAVHWYELAVIGVALALETGRLGAALAASRRAESPTLRSNATHFATDMLGSLAVLAGLLAVRAGMHDGDSVAALLVAAIIFASAIRLIGENANVLMDRAPVDAQVVAERAIAALGADIELGRLRLRESAGRYFADVVVSVPPGQAVVEGHQAADLVEGALEQALPGSDVVVHVEPLIDPSVAERARAAAASVPGVGEIHNLRVVEINGRSELSLHLKLPGGFTLEQAHEIAERLEQEIRNAVPEIDRVQSHLEPLSESGEAAEVAGDAAVVERVVLETTGVRPSALRFLRTDGGVIAYLTLPLERDVTLEAAHARATEIEARVRQEAPDIAELIVHTEPSGSGEGR